MTEDMTIIAEEAYLAAKEILEKARLEQGELFVVGCSTSEVGGATIGTYSSPELAEMVFGGIYQATQEAGVYLAAQCCEHLNRALILEKEAAVKYGSLYTENTYVDGTLNVRIDVRKGNDPQDEAWILGMLLLVLKDLQNGLLAVGGQTAIGRGIFSANGPITIDGECSVENFLIGNLLKHMTEKGGGEA